MEVSHPPGSKAQAVAISSHMSAHDIIRQLGKHGCQNITDRLDFAACTMYPLSTGGFGDVYQGKLRDGTQIAIKTMRLEIGTTDDVRKHLKHAARELHIWSKCQHPNVLPLIGLVTFRDQIGMVSRWIERGNLPSYIQQNSGLDRFQMSAEISAGLAYLHENGIVHGDLKGLNVLVNGDGAPMLTDFGNAVLQDCSLNFTATTRKNSLSPRWAAPELLDEREGTHSREADVYALGMTVLETFTGQVPYADKSDLRVITMVVVLKELPTRPTVHIPPNSRHGDALWSLLKRCWVNEPEDRPKASEVAKIMREFRRPSMAEKEGLSKLEQRLQEGATTKWHGFWAGAMLRLGNSTRKPGLSRNPNVGAGQTRNSTTLPTQDPTLGASNPKNSSPASSSSGNTGAKGSLGGAPAPAPAPAPVTSPSLPPISLRLELEIWVAALKAYDEEDYGKSLETFGRIANSAKILTNIGLIHATVGEHEAAVQRFREAVSLDQYLAVAYFQCGVSNFLLDRYDEAHGDFDDALLYLRDNQFINYEQVGLRFRLYSAEILFNRGLCQIFMGRLDIGLQDMREAQKAKVTKEHNVFDDAILERGEGYTVFSIPVGVLYRPSESKLKNAKAKGFLGGAQLITSPDAKDTVTTSTGTTGLQRRERVSEWRGGYDKRYAG